MTTIFLIITVILLVLTAGCGFAIHLGGDEFKNAIMGPMILGVLTIIFAVLSLIMYLLERR